MNENDDIEYEIGVLDASTEKLFRDIDEIDATEDFGMSSPMETVTPIGASVEELSSDKFINNLQKARKRWYGDFIANRTKLYNKNIMWLQELERNKDKLTDGFKRAKSTDSKEIGKIVAAKMDGRFPAAMSLINGSDLKQVKHSRLRYSKLKDEIKHGVSFIKKMGVYADKEFGFNSLMDGKLNPEEVVTFIKDSYADSPNVASSLASIRIYGVKRRFKTDKRQLMLDAINADGSRTVLLSWSGSSVKFLTVMAGGETRIWNRPFVNPNATYEDFYKKHSDDAERHISDTTAITNLIDEMKNSIVIMNKINNSLAKLYMPSKRTFDELKFIRRFHMNITKILAFRIDDMMTSYRISHSVAKIVEKASR